MTPRDDSGRRTGDQTKSNGLRRGSRHPAPGRTTAALLLITLFACAILAAGCTSRDLPDRNVTPALAGGTEGTAVTRQTFAPLPSQATAPAPLLTTQPTATATPAITKTTTAQPTSTKTATTVTTSAKTYTRPSTGALIAGKRILGGYGKLKIDNVNGTYDIVAILTRWHSVTPLFGIYIRERDAYTNENIPDGMYDFYVLSGENWDKEKNRFDDNAEYLQFDTPLSYTTSEKWVVILYPVEDENAEGELVPVPQKDFPDL